MSKASVGGAPVCNLNPPQNYPQPTIPTLPAIPTATDLQSAISAINTLTNLIQQLFNMISQTNARLGLQRAGGGGGVNPSPALATSGVQQNAGNFTVQSIKQQKKRIYNPQDNSQYVDVNQITGVTWGNRAGQTITFSQPGS